MKKILFLITFLSAQLIFSQVLNDQVVTQEGKFGIGTESPEYKLHIKTGGTPATPILGFKLEDGNQLESRVLTTDASGTATWKDIVINKIFGVLNSSTTQVEEIVEAPNIVGVVEVPNIDDVVAGSEPLNLKSYIELPPGKWEVEANILLDVGTELNDSYTWIKFSFTEEEDGTFMSPSLSGTTKFISNSIITQNLVGGGINHAKEQFFGIANGRVEITNSTLEPKRYYLYYHGSQYKGAKRTFKGLGHSFYSENYIVAKRAQ